MSSHHNGKVECNHPIENCFVNGKGVFTCEKCGTILDIRPLYNQRDIDETGYQNDGMYPSGRF